jgi:hypothetical protein
MFPKLVNPAFGPCEDEAAFEERIRKIGKRFLSQKNLIGNGNVRKAEALANQKRDRHAARICRDNLVDWKNAQGQAESH